jgi:hypothetical protein
MAQQAAILFCSAVNEKARHTTGFLLTNQFHEVFIIYLFPNISHI